MEWTSQSEYEFLFQTGAIKSDCRVYAYATMRCFYSKLVRLKVIMIEGTLRTNTCFYSKLVRLKADVDMFIEMAYSRFYSKLVRLKAVATFSAATGAITFLFQTGAIKRASAAICFERQGRSFYSKLVRLKEAGSVMQKNPA